MCFTNIISFYMHFILKDSDLTFTLSCLSILCGSRKYPYSPHRRDWNFLGVGGSLRPKKLKKCMELNWNFQRGGEVLRKIPSVGEVWIFSGTTHWLTRVKKKKKLPQVSGVPKHSVKWMISPLFSAWYQACFPFTRYLGESVAGMQIGQDVQNFDLLFEHHIS